MGGSHWRNFVLPQGINCFGVRLLCQVRIWVKAIHKRVRVIGFELSRERPTEASYGKTWDEFIHSVMQVYRVLIDWRHLIRLKKNLSVVVPRNVKHLTAFLHQSRQRLNDSPIALLRLLVHAQIILSSQNVVSVCLVATNEDEVEVSKFSCAHFVDISPCLMHI